MEAKKKCVFGSVGLILSLFVIVLVWPLQYHFMDSPENLYAYMGRFKYIIPLNVLWPSSSSSSSSLKNTKKLQFPISPNLSTCHHSYGRPDLLVYCCPPSDVSKATAVDFQFSDPASSPLRLRRPTNLLDADYIAKYNKALSIMKSLPFSDPRSFVRQAQMHCIYCTGAYYQNHDIGVPLNIHGSWLFFPWHRMFLHFHERILGSLIGDDSFAVPFWPWDVPATMSMPEMYLNDASSFYDSERDPSHSPPRVADLDFWGTESGLEHGEQIETNLGILYNQMVSGAKKPELFMGCPYKAGDGGYCHQHGTLEIGAHDTVHNWVGSDSHPGREHMGKFYSAAHDPIFYAHHSNIDRLWELWRELHGNHKFNVDISDPDWLDSYFYFHDEKLQLVRIKIRDVLDITKLRYAYEKIDTPWIHARPKPSVPPKTAREMLMMREFDNHFIILASSTILKSDFRPHGRVLDTRLTTKVMRPKINRSKKEKEEEEEVLVVYGIDVKDEDMFVKFDVHVNVVDETRIGPRFREFAGSFVQIPRGGVMEGERRKQNLKLGISELVEDLEADGDESIWVTLVPMSGSCANVTIDGIRVDFVR